MRRLFSILTGARAVKSPVAPKRPPAPSEDDNFLPPDMDAGGSLGVTSDGVNNITRLWTPQQAESVLAAAYGGDLSQQAHLLTGMMDTWHTLADNTRTLADAIVGAPWELRPATGPDGEVSPEAQARRDLVWAAWQGMQPDICEGELGMDAARRLWARGCIGGHTVTEILWERRDGDILPRALRRVGSRWYGYPDASRSFRFRDKAGTWMRFPEDKFAVQIIPAHDGHPSQSGRWRVLAKYWAGATYGWEWLMTYTNKFGTPFRLATYDQKNSNVRATLLSMLANLGTAGYGAFPAGTKVELIEAAKGSGDLPQALLMRLASEACDLVIRGEVSTGGTAERQGFSKGDVQNGVRRQSMQGYANEVASPMDQVNAAILRQNYGTDDLCPTWVAEFPEPQDAKVLAERDQVLLAAGVPIKLAELQRRHDIEAPASGDQVLWAGQIKPWAEPGDVVPAPAPGVITAAKAPQPDGVTLQAVMERLLINAVVAGAEEFDNAAAGKEGA